MLAEEAFWRKMMISFDQGSIPNFDPHAQQVVGCFLQAEDKFLFLQRALDKREPELFGVPGGKAGESEPLSYAMGRELKEETGICVTLYCYFGCTYVRHGESRDFRYHLFRAVLPWQPLVVLASNEHTAFRWVTLEEALMLPLIPDMDFCVRHMMGVL